MPGPANRRKKNKVDLKVTEIEVTVSVCKKNVHEFMISSVTNI